MTDSALLHRPRRPGALATGVSRPPVRSRSHPPRRGNPWGIHPYLAVAALFFAVSLILSWAGAAFLSDIGADDDEPSHVVTGLMVFDYLRQGLGDPFAFARTYYLHYPKVALGQWPPVFYLLQTGWMFLFGASTWSLILLMNALTAATATAITAAVRATTGWWIAILAGMLFLTMPLVQSYAGRVMTEIPLALLCFLATVQFGRFLETGRARHSWGFALFSVLAIMTKGNGLALGLLPVFALLLSRRWQRLTQPSLWLAGGAVVLVCAPWYAVFLPISATSWDGAGKPLVEHALRSARFYGPGLVQIGGVAMLAVAGIGLCSRRRRGVDGVWAAVIGLIPSLILFHLLVPSSVELRHLVLGLPAFAMLLAAGMAWFCELTTRPGMRIIFPLALTAFFVAEHFQVPGKSCGGFQDTVQELAAQPALREATMLIASDARGEGAIVAGTALSEPRPGRIVLRGSKVLATSGWCGEGYTPRFETQTELAEFLRSASVAVVLIDLSTRADRWRPHHDQLLRLCTSRPSAWKELPERAVLRRTGVQPRGLRIFVQRGHERFDRSSLQLESVLGTRALPFGMAASQKPDGR